MSVLDILSDYNQEKMYFDDDLGWRQFVVDHRTILQDRSDIRNVTEELAQQCYQDIPALFRHIGTAGAGGSPDTRLVWIFLIINDLANNLDFTTGRVYYFPRIVDINALYTTYQTSSNPTN